MKCLPLLAALATSAAHAEDMWLTIVGDLTNPAVDTVEVSPTSVVREGDLRLMKIRTNRKNDRIAYDAKPYRSYYGKVQIDCTTMDARFREIRLFPGPLWSGGGRDVAYPREAMPKVALQDFSPNPISRIVRAACPRSAATN